MTAKSIPRLAAEAIVADVMRHATKGHWSPGRTRSKLLRAREMFLARIVVADTKRDLGMSALRSTWYRAALYILGGHIRRLPDRRQLLLVGLPDQGGRQ